MPVDRMRQLREPLGRDSTHVPAHRFRRVKGPPSENLPPPRQVGILAIGEKIFVEELPLETEVLHGFPSEESGCAACTKNIFRFFILAYVLGVPTAIEVAQVAGEIHPGRVENIGELWFAP